MRLSSGLAMPAVYSVVVGGPSATDLTMMIQVANELLFGQ